MRVGRRHRNKRALTIVANGTPSFDPTLGVLTGSIGFSRWDFGDGTVEDNNPTPNHTYADNNQYTVTAYRRYMREITSILCNVDVIISADLSELIGLGGTTGGQIGFENNATMVSVILPKDQVNPAPITNIRFDNTNIAGVFDMTSLKFVSGNVWVNGTDITAFDASSPLTGGSLGTDITSVRLNNCTLLVTADLSGMTTMRSALQFNQCALLNTVTFPNTTGISTGSMTSMAMYQCSQLTSIDLTNMENAGGSFNAYQNPSLVSILLPAVPTANITNLRIETNTSLVGALDWSAFTHTGSQIRYQNTSLTTFVPPVAADISLYWGYQNPNITGVLDLSNITVLRNSINLRDCPNMTGVTFNATAHAQSTGSLLIYNCDLTGVIDLTYFEGLGNGGNTGDVELQNNPNLTGITHAATLSPFGLDRYYAYSCDLTGVLDVSKLNIQGDFRVYSNSNLTGVTINSTPTANGFNTFWVYDCNITGTLDLTGIQGGVRNFDCHNNPNLTTLTFDAGMTMYANGTVFDFVDCNITGVLDISMFDKLGGRFWGYNNANLTGITFPTSTVAFTDMRVYNTGLTSVDFSSLSGFNGRIEFQNNALTSVTFPTVSAAFTNFFFGQNSSLGYIDLTPLTGSTFGSVTVNNNGMTTAEVNQMLVEFDGMVGVVGSGTFQIQNNSAPDGSSGGFDGLTAKANLQAKGWTVTTD